jgi:septal ring factor EnvC (AmiA/AmiB activator)
VALVVFLPTFSMASPRAAWAQANPDQRLKELESVIQRRNAEKEQMRHRHEALSEELNKLKAEMVKAAKAAQESEEILTDLEEQLKELAKDEQAKSEAQMRRREQMAGVLTALQRMAWRPSEALMAQPTSPADTVRSAILLRAVVPRIEDSAKDLKTDLEVLSALRGDILRQRKKITATSAKLEGEHARLKGMFERKAELVSRTDGEVREIDKKIAQMATEASDLRELMARLEQERKIREAQEAARLAAEKEARERARLAALQEAKSAGQPPPKEQEEPKTAKSLAPASQPFSEAKGRMPYPARGKVVARYGQTNEVGTINKGLIIATRGSAQVVAPYDGHVAFAGEFRGYGLLLIIEHGEGYHTLLAGMDRIDSIVGQRVVAGEPVGIMGGEDVRPTLYVELRRNGQPVNPLPWLSARKDKVNG